MQKVLTIILVGVLLLGAGFGIGIWTGAGERGKLSASLAEAIRYSDALRKDFDGLGKRLGELVGGMEIALGETGRIGNLIERLRARDSVYADIARQLRSIAEGLEGGGAAPTE